MDQPLGFNQIINEMSYIQNVSSNDNLLSPYMFSNNSSSPSKQPLQLAELQPSFINNSSGDHLSQNQLPQQLEYSSLERSLKKVVVPLDNSKLILDSSSANHVRKVRRNFIRKMSGPASKLFPPGFFADNNSVDSKQSPMKNLSVDTATVDHQHLMHINMSIKSNLQKPNEIFSQMSVAGK